MLMVSLLRKTEKGTCAAVVVEVKNVKSVSEEDTG